MQHTTHYSFNEPQMGEQALITKLNENAESIDTLLYNHKINIANVYSTGSLYEVDDYVMYDDVLYKCIAPVTTPGTFNPSKWQQCNVADEIGTADYIELTTEQYNALTPAQQNDGTIYFITDGGSTSTNYIQAIIYSTEERQIGVWTNGKPLYQKTVEGSFTNTSTAESIHTILPASTISGVLHAESIFITDGSYIDATIVSDSGATSSIDNDGNLVIRIKGAAAGTISYKVTIQYTKRTDVAGSGIFTQSAVPSVHYMTAEHVIGTWIDGSTMYEKTFSLASQIAISTGTNQVVSAIDSSVKVVGSEVVSPAFIHFGSCDVYTEQGGLMVRNNRSDAIIVKYVTIRYIKVTS